MTVKLQTISQQRAKKVHNSFESLLKLSKKELDERQIKLKEYKSYCGKLPSLIVNNGLVATLTFMCDKKKTWKALYDTLSEFIKEDFQIRNDLLKYLLSENCSSAQYRHISRTALRYAEWMKRFASIMIPDQNEGEENE